MSKFKIFKFEITTYELLLGAILIFFLVTRFYKIAEIPASLYWDEASISVNANSIATTGLDEWGQRFPLHFRAFGEFKLPVYVYSTAILSFIFGLQDWVVRVPAIMYFGFAIILVYLISLKLTNKRQIAFFSAFAMSISHWGFLISRTGYEATAGLFFYLLGILIMLYSGSKRWLTILGLLSFILSLYSYNSYRIISLISFFILFFVFINRKKIWKEIGLFILSSSILIISLVPIARVLLYDSGFSRTESFSLVPNIQQVYDLKGNPHYQIIYNRSEKLDWIKIITEISKNYFSHLNPQYLFLDGDKNPRNGIPGYGQLYYLDLIFLIAALVYLFRKKQIKLYLIILFMALSFIPPSLFKESPHSLRAFSSVPFFSMLIGIGIYYSLRNFKKGYPIIIVLYLAFFGMFYSDFIQNYNLNYANEWQVGYKKLFFGYKEFFGGYDQILISDEYAQPYIFALYYLKIKPEEFRRTVAYSPINDWGFSTVSSFGNFSFVKKFDELPKGKLLLFVSRNETINSAKILGEISGSNNKTLFKVYEYNSK